MPHADLLKALLPAAYEKTGPKLSADIAAHGAQLDQFQALAGTLVDELDPRSTTVLLPEWEAAYGLPEAVALTSATTLAERRAALVAKINSGGTMSKTFFKNALQAAGFQVVIDQPREFAAGVGRAGDRIYAPGACVWYWRVRLRKAGLPVSVAEKNRVAAWINQAKPAYSFFDIED